MREIIIKYKHFSLLLVFAFVGIIFGFCEKLITPKIVVYSVLDDYIPFVKEALIPYLLWYVYITVAIIYLGLTSKIDFQRLLTFIISGMVIAIVAYIISPNEQALRPEITGNDVFSRIIERIYSIDTPTNVCPSIHVLNSIAVHTALVNSHPLEAMKKIKFASFISMILISFSTVFVKQHSIIDVFWGGLIGFVIYICIYKVPNPLSVEGYVPSQENNIVKENNIVSE